MNNDSIIRDCAQVSGRLTVLPPATSPAPVSGLCRSGPRLPRSSLASCQLVRARTREEMRQLAEAAWRQRGLALIDPLLITDDFARQALINEANRLYGRRGAEGEVQP